MSLALVHPALHETRVEAVESQNDELLPDGVGRPACPAARGGANAQGKQDEKVAFHKRMRGRKTITSEVR